MKTTRPENHRAIIVCTDKRGVFFGYVPDNGQTDHEMLQEGATVSLAHARMAVYWTRKEKGVLGLAEFGPSDRCKIGSRADITVSGVHAVVSVTDAAAERWELAPWA